MREMVRKNKKLALTIFVITLFLSGLSFSGFCQGESVVQQGPSIEVIADVKPCIRMSLSTDNIYFYAGKGPGTYEPVVKENPDQPAEPVIVTVGCNAREWSIQCKATSLKETDTRKGKEKGVIPASRIFVVFPSYENDKDAGGEENELPLDAPVTILQGGPGETRAKLKFKMKTTWSDRAGNYSGKISFTCMMRP